MLHYECVKNTNSLNKKRSNKMQETNLKHLKTTTVCKWLKLLFENKIQNKDFFFIFYPSVTFTNYMP